MIPEEAKRDEFIMKYDDFRRSIPRRPERRLGPHMGRLEEGGKFWSYRPQIKCTDFF